MVYLKLPKILGMVKKKGYEGWIPVESVSFGTEDRWDETSETGRASISYTRAIISRKTDRTTRDLFSAYLRGTRFDEAKVAFVQPPKSVVRAHRFTMKDAACESFSVQGTADTFELHFVGVRVTTDLGK